MLPYVPGLESFTRPLLSICNDFCAGFDEAMTEFVRVPSNTENLSRQARGLGKTYHASELGGTPLAVQLMGGGVIFRAFDGVAILTVSVKGC